MTLPPDRQQTTRWIVAFALALICHGSVVAAVSLQRRDGAPGGVEAVIAIDLAPLMQAPQESAVDLPPAPVEQAALPDPPDETPAPIEPEPEQKTETPLPLDPPPPEILPPPPPEAVTMPAEPPPPEVRKPKPRKPPARQAAAPPRRQAEGPKIAGPAPGSANAAAGVASWQSRVAVHLNSHKRYPPEAQTRGETGTALLVFSIDRSGHVLSAALGRSSGSAALDKEATALARRASPVPAPPPEMGGDHIRLSVTVRFTSQWQ
jgi:periplasmic protein TonB